ncbi:uncharacterized protein LOC128738318 [Sabethes cyaneus]|uniref:uncharacterized protein LOC128738318 n=1 Tax=Sabethes cyaneus TaxID=53552 RepID=UPI00237E3AFF|nr:uncharacterized protein LOC128738318 [Sabethes cyaneus]
MVAVNDTIATTAMEGETASVASEIEAGTTAPSNAPSLMAGEIMNALRRELEKRRLERQQQIDERRDNFLKNLQDLSFRRREYELRLQERMQTSAEQRTARRNEIEARRVGRIPTREQDRVLMLRQQRMQQSEPNDAENEVDSTAGEVAPSPPDVLRSIVLIEEASGNVRLVDLGTREGRELAARVTGRMENENERREEMDKLRLKMGQL